MQEKEHRTPLHISTSPSVYSGRSYKAEEENMVKNAYNFRRWIYGMILGCLLTVGFFHFTKAHAQSLIIATGSQNGTYHQMFQELNHKCAADGLNIQEKLSGGSNDNIDKLVANQVNGAIVQTDVIYFRSKTEDLSKVSTLFSLHSEQVHLIARSEITSGGFSIGSLNIGGKTIHFNSILDLNGRNVGASGGSVLTAKVIKAQSSINYNVVEFPSNSAALAALQKGEIDGVVIVGGEPMKDIEALPATYRLLPIPPQVQDKLKAVYQPARLSYRNLNAAGVPTVSIKSLLITREYKSPQYVSLLKAYRTCFMNHIDELQETVGTAPAWQSVDAKDQGKWHWEELK